MNQEMNRQIARLREALAGAKNVLIGAGAGLSTAAGYEYSGARFERYFGDFGRKYGFADMYSGGFYPYSTEEERWAFWSRNLWINRYMMPPKPVYQTLHSLVQDKDYFVLTTNVDHCFQRAGFDKARLFCTQGDYGLFQCARPCHKATYDNEAMARAMLQAQGFAIGPKGELIPPAEGGLRMTVPRELVPRCPRCGGPMSMNLRSDDTFVEDEGWHAAADRYTDWVQTRLGKEPLLLLELGVGGNTPGIIKFPFWRMTMAHANVTYACVNRDEAVAPEQIADRAICVQADFAEVLEALAEKGRQNP